VSNIIVLKVLTTQWMPKPAQYFNLSHNIESR